MAPPQWAYQLEHFVEEPDEELVCSICRSVFCDPVMCPCDHVYCQGCINKWLQANRNCPICRKRMSTRSIKQIIPIVKNIIMKLMLNCHNKTLGCAAQFSLESSEAHLKECEYELVQCKNKPCTDKLFRKDITEHETTDCPHRCFKCKKCGSRIPKEAVAQKHNCIQALRMRILKKKQLIQKRNERIKELKKEIKDLKASSQTPEQAVSSTSRDLSHSLDSSTFSNLSPEEIIVNFSEFESESSLSSSDDSSSSDSIIIFTHGPLDHSDNAESDSFFSYMDNDDSIEYSRNESPRDFNEYRHVECQTANDMPLNDSTSDRNDNSFPETGDNSATASEDNQNEESSQSQRPAKRRPTTQKPAKRRLPPPSPTSTFLDGTTQDSSPHSPKRCWRSSSPSMQIDSVGDKQRTDHTSQMEAGPSSVAVSVPGSSTGVSDVSSKQFRSKSKLDQKRIKQGSNPSGNAMKSKAATPSRNAVFERTLALLEQYNLESDPEWLPQFASHTGDTSSDDSESLCLDIDNINESSSSDDSDSSSEDNSHGNPDAEFCDLARRLLVNSSHFDFNFRSFDSSSDSEEDPDWRPL